MKIVYVLVSDEKDTYYEQTLISIKSLQKCMPNADVNLLVDSDTYDSFRGKRSIIFSSGVKIKSIALPEDMNKKDRSRYLKTTMRRVIEGAFLYVDGDTIICRNLDDIDTTMVLAGVKDKHFNYSEHPSKLKIDKRSAKCGYTPAYNDIHFNGGLMWVSNDNSTFDFFELWHELWKLGLEHGVTQDQASLNEANVRMKGIIHELDGEWNCQLSNRTAAMRYIHNARVLHYFASYGDCSVPYDLANSTVLKSIISGDDTTKLDTILEDPKSAFTTVYTLVSNLDDSNILETETYSFIKNIYLQHRTIFNTSENLIHLFRAIKRRMKN